MDEARAVMDTLPLSKEQLVDDEYIPVGPLMPLGGLIGGGAQQWLVSAHRCGFREKDCEAGPSVRANCRRIFHDARIAHARCPLAGPRRG
jgi:hypothetical protein